MSYHDKENPTDPVIRTSYRDALQTRSTKHNPNINGSASTRTKTKNKATSTQKIITQKEKNNPASPQVETGVRLSTRSTSAFKSRSPIDNIPQGNTFKNKKDKDSIRILFQNINSLQPTTNIKWMDILNEVQNMEADIVGLSETCTDWKKRTILERHHKDTRKVFKKSHLNYSRNKTIAIKEGLPGGMLQLCIGNITGRINQQLHDSWNMGRWCGHKLQMSNDQHLFIITAYRVCKGSVASVNSSTTSSCRQQYMIMRENGILSPNPRQQFITDLIKLKNGMLHPQITSSS